MDQLVFNRSFEQIDFTKEALPLGEYEQCRFVRCNFSNVNLGKYRFIDCSFHDCNLSLVQLTQTVLSDVTFKGCKMIGLHFETCASPGLAVAFEHCQLSNSSFYQTTLRNTVFGHCLLSQADFTEADLTNAVFDNCDLYEAIFDRTRLEKADCTTAYNYIIDPTRNRVKQAKFSWPGIAGLLQQFQVVIKH